MENVTTVKAKCQDNRESFLVSPVASLGFIPWEKNPIHGPQWSLDFCLIK